MEDLSENDEEEKKKLKKRKRLSFFDSWRRLIEEPKEKQVSAERDMEEAETRPPFSKAAWQTIKEFLKEFMHPPSKLKVQDEEATLDFGSASVDKVYGAEVVSETPLIGTEGVEAIKKELETPKTSLQEGGELIISHDEEEIPEEIAQPTPKAVQPEIYDRRESTNTVLAPAEPIGRIVERLEKQSLGAFSAAETLSRYRDRQLKRTVVKLNKQAKKIEKDQKNLRYEQEEFKTQLQPETHPSLLSEKLAERGRWQQNSELLENRSFDKQPETRLKPQNTGINNNDIPKVQPKGAEKYNFSKPADRPETVLHLVEEAAEKNIPIESTYERRHEIKDEAGSRGAVSGANISDSRGIYPIPIPIRRVQQPPISPFMAQSSQPDTPNPQIGSSQMYSNAVKSGFWTAITLLVIWLVLYIAT